MAATFSITPPAAQALWRVFGEIAEQVSDDLKHHTYNAIVDDGTPTYDTVKSLAEMSDKLAVAVSVIDRLPWGQVSANVNWTAALEMAAAYATREKEALDEAEQVFHDDKLPRYLDTALEDAGRSRGYVADARSVVALCAALSVSDLDGGPAITDEQAKAIERVATVAWSDLLPMDVGSYVGDEQASELVTHLATCNRMMLLAGKRQAPTDFFLCHDFEILTRRFTDSFAADADAMLKKLALDEDLNDDDLSLQDDRAAAAVVLEVLKLRKKARDGLPVPTGWVDAALRALDVAELKAEVAA